MKAIREQLLDVYTSLDRMHAWRGWHWWPDADPFEVVVGAILVQNTAWTNVEKALALLRSASALDPLVMSRLPVEQLEDLVRPSGQYRQKTRKLIAFLELVREQGSLEDLLLLPAGELRTKLLATWGIGPETADCIVIYAARRPAFVIDAYTARLFMRLGLGPVGLGYDAWQRWFLSNLGELEDEDLRRDFWARYHALIVMHCKHLCLKSRPRCESCELRPSCPASLAFMKEVGGLSDASA